MTSIPILTVDDEHRLQCPSCGQVNGLHVDRVELAGPTGHGLRLFDPGEDDSTGGVLAEEVDLEEVFRSTRRHSAVLTMWCELCGQEARVGFLQHKGETYARQALRSSEA